jgi:hypothetical protein
MSHDAAIINIVTTDCVSEEDFFLFTIVVQASFLFDDFSASPSIPNMP